MLVRLWWKEGRTLAPIAATVSLAALLLQWFLGSYGGDWFQRGPLVGLGLGWAILYALVAATASFAGEHETRMMAYLDALPVDRSLLWVGKASFALVSSLILAFALALVGWMGTDAGSRIWAQIGAGPGDILLLLLEAVAWGLLWSSLCRTAIGAGVGAAVSVAVISTTLLRHGLSTDVPLHAWAFPVRMLLAVVAAGASWRILTHEVLPQARRAPRPITFSIPVAVRRALRPEPRVSLGTVGPGQAAQPRRTLLPTPAFYRLVWQTLREGRSTWLLALGLSVGTLVPGILFFQDDGTNALLMMFAVVLALLIQGVSVFGLENAAGTRAFLDHQAVPPGTIWAAKVVPWAGGLALFALIVTLASLVCAGRFWGPLPTNAQQWVPFLIILGGALNAPGVALIAGMMFRRRVTATLVALMGAVVVTVLPTAVLAFEMAPAWAALAVPVVLLGISRGWAGDWVGDRGGWRRWVRLAGLVAAPGLLLALLYIGGRAYGIADVGPQGSKPSNRSSLPGSYQLPAEEANVPPPPAAQDLVRRIGQFILEREDQNALANRGWRRPSASVVALWESKSALVPESLALARAAGPLSFGPNQQPMSFEQIGPRWVLLAVNQLLMIDSVKRRSEGDAAGAWDDILAQIQLSDRLANGAWTPFEYQQALDGTEQAIRQGVAWASDPQVPLAAIEAARASLSAVESVPDARPIILHEADRYERWLNRPTEALVNEMVAPPSYHNADRSDILTAFRRIEAAWIIAPSWERERTRRIARRAVAEALTNLGSGRGWRPGTAMPPSQGGSPLKTPLAEHLVWPVSLVQGYSEQSATYRQMFDLFLRLRAWQLTHDGRSPASLADLFGGDSTQVPIDPLSPDRHPFGYRIDEANPARTTTNPPMRVRLLSSVGLDGQDHQGRHYSNHTGFAVHHGTAFEDLVFALPAEPAEPKP